MHIKAEGLVKRINGIPFINGLSLEARAGHILGLVGPEGAGKTTVLQLLLNLIPCDEGQVTIDDKPLTGKVLDRMGFLPEKGGSYPVHSLNQTLIYFARLKNMPRKKASVEAVRLIDRFGMIDLMDIPVGHLPTEAREKLQIMRAIIHNPEAILLDDPLKHLSLPSQNLVRKLVQRFKEEGKTIILATEKFDEAEQLCDEVVVLNEGQVVLRDKVKDIRANFQENLILVEGADNLQSLQSIHGVKKLVQEKQVARLYVDNRIPPQKILDVIIKTIKVTRLEVHRPRLSDIFLDVVNSRQKGGL